MYWNTIKYIKYTYNINVRYHMEWLEGLRMCPIRRTKSQSSQDMWLHPRVKRSPFIGPSSSMDTTTLSAKHKMQIDDIGSTWQLRFQNQDQEKEQKKKSNLRKAGTSAGCQTVSCSRCGENQAFLIQM